MDKNKLLIIVILVLALGAVLSVVYLKNKDKVAVPQELQTEPAPDTYTVSARVKQVNDDSVIIEIPMLAPDKTAASDIVYEERKLKIYRGQIEIVRRITSNGNITYNNIQLSALRSGMEVMVTASANPADFEEFFGTKIEVIR